MLKRTNVVQPRGMAPWEWRGRESKITVIGGGTKGTDERAQFSGLSESTDVDFVPNFEATGKRLETPLDSDASACGFLRPAKEMLGVWRGTAICANDVTGSIYYSSGPLIQQAGIFAPLCYMMVGCVLFLFRNIYVEVVTALPLNGGAYSAFINLTSKRLAVVMSVLSIVSYIATVCTNAATAVAFLTGGLDIPELNQHGVMEGMQMAVVAIMASLMLIGLRESAGFSAAIFILHMVTETILVVVGIYVGFRTGWVNIIDLYHTSQPGGNGIAYSIFFGWASAMLGVTGYETSANFVEEQAPGVFPKTLRNMWAISSVMNPLLTLTAFVVVPASALYSSDNTSAMLLNVGKFGGPFIGGNWLSVLIVIDSVTILTGTVLTGFVGITGLFRRLCHDKCLPAWFLKSNPWTKANYPIPLFFCFLCITLMAITNGDVASFNSTYTIAFLLVMSSFGVANLLLKHHRTDLRNQKSLAISPVWRTILAICCTSFCLVLNIILSPITLVYFGIYFGGFLIVMGLYSMRGSLLLHLAHLVEQPALESGDTDKQCAARACRATYLWCFKTLETVHHDPIVFLSRRLDLRDINKAVEYVLANEASRSITVVHGFRKIDAIPQHVIGHLQIIKEIHPNIRVDLLCIHMDQTTFGPGFVRAVQTLTDVSSHQMFIASPSPKVTYDLAELGSLRIIMRRNDRDFQDFIASGFDMPTAPEEKSY